MKLLVSLIVFVFITTGLFAQYTIEGTVNDAATNKPLAFVTVILPDKNKGTMTDIVGKYSLKSDVPIDSVLFSYMGYEVFKHRLSKEELHNSHLTINVSLKPTNYTLKEVIFNAGENPAHRIINKVIENRDANNPDKLHSYTYKSYNKFIFTTDVDSAIKGDSLKEHGLADSTKKRIHDFLDKSYIFLVESITEKKFLYPDNSKETVIASRVSGLKDPSFSLIASEMQSFSFYNDYFVLSERNYLNPLSKNSTHKYYFNIEDTTWNGKDTVFIISYKPRAGKNFDGLRGLLYINTNGYAVQNVIAEPAELKRKFSMKVQQQYQLMPGGHWFPIQLNTDLIMHNAVNGFADLNGIGRTYIQDVRFDTTLSRRLFDDIALDYEPGMKPRDEEFWNNYRHDTLTVKERNTYVVIDSIGKENNLDNKLKLFLALGNNRLPISIFDLNIDKIINENDYEGFRLGIGMHTNDRLSQHFIVGGYYAYGFKDKATKYGLDGSILLSKRRDIRIGGSYAHDVLESGAQNFFDDIKSFLNEEFRKFSIVKMDAIEERKAFISGNLVRYITANIYFRLNQTRATDNYRFEGTGLQMPSNDFRFNEVGIGLRYAYKEKFVKAFDQKLSNGTKYPVVWLNVSKSLSESKMKMPTNMQGQYSYTRLDFQLEKSFRIRNVGKSSFVINAGYVNGSVPYPILFNGKGSNATIDNLYHTSFYSGNSFQTMGMNEFLSDRFAAVFFTHNFGHLLFRSKKFQPTISVITNLGIGNLTHPEFQQNIPFKTMDKGFYESGFLINNVYKFSFTRIGLGFFYRYGPYSNIMPQNNCYFKISWTFFI